MFFSLRLMISNLKFDPALYRYESEKFNLGTPYMDLSRTHSVGTNKSYCKQLYDVCKLV